MVFRKCGIERLTQEKGNLRLGIAMGFYGFCSRKFGSKFGNSDVVIEITNHRSEQGYNYFLFLPEKSEIRPLSRV
jgi:hypothetical protein